jgi:hypothetical protein
MRHETIEQEVAALWMHYTVIEKMTGAYSDYLENSVYDTARRVISTDLQDTTVQIPRERNVEIDPVNEGTIP